MKISFEQRHKDSVKYSDMKIGQFFVYGEYDTLFQKVDDGLFFQYELDIIYSKHICDQPEKWLNNLYIADVDLFVKIQRV